MDKKIDNGQIEGKMTESISKALGDILLDSKNNLNNISEINSIFFGYVNGESLKSEATSKATGWFHEIIDALRAAQANITDTKSELAKLRKEFKE